MNQHLLAYQRQILTENIPGFLHQVWIVAVWKLEVCNPPLLYWVLQGLGQLGLGCFQFLRYRSVVPQNIAKSCNCYVTVEYCNDNQL